jgi:uncharacterized SAM-binding protein YcdF (DUF218 family)
MRQRQPSLRKALFVFFWSTLGAFLAAFAIIFGSAGMIYDVQDSVDGANLPEVDAIVVLAGGRGRIATAGDLWYRYWENAQVPLEGFGPRLPPRRKVPVLYFAGVGPQATWLSVSQQVRRGVLAVIGPRDFLLERQSENTIENVEWLIGTALSQGWNSILLVTSTYHMRRARSLFERIEKMNRESGRTPLRLETLSVLTDPFEPGDWSASVTGIRVTMLEYLKWLYLEVLWKPAKKELSRLPVAEP